MCVKIKCVLYLCTYFILKHARTMVFLLQKATQVLATIALVTESICPSQPSKSVGYAMSISNVSPHSVKVETDLILYFQHPPSPPSPSSLPCLPL